jgi:SAM-dependent methyltransferase
MRAGLAERYVREWLAVMATARRRRLRRRPAHLAPARRARGVPDARRSPATLPSIAQYWCMIGARGVDLSSASATGGGLPYERYRRFHEVMAEDSAQTVVHALFDAILPLVPGLDASARAGIRVLDVGCGRGAALLAMADVFREPLRRLRAVRRAPWQRPARSPASAASHNVVFEQRDLAAMPLERTASISSRRSTRCTTSATRRTCCARSAPHCAGDGLFLMQDIGGSSAHRGEHATLPLAPLLYAVSCAHCTPRLAGAGRPWAGHHVGLRTWRWKCWPQAGFAAVERRTCCRTT